MIRIPWKTPTDDCSLGGGYQAAGSLEALNNGAKVIIAGLFVQPICFGFFLSLWLLLSIVQSTRHLPEGLTAVSCGGNTRRRHMPAAS